MVTKETCEEAIGEMAQYLKLQRQALGLQRTMFPPTQYAEFNAAFQAQPTQLAEEIDWSDISKDPRFVIGDKVCCSTQHSTAVCVLYCLCACACTVDWSEHDAVVGWNMTLTCY